MVRLRRLPDFPSLTFAGSTSLVLPSEYYGTGFNLLNVTFARKKKNTQQQFQTTQHQFQPAQQAYSQMGAIPLVLLIKMVPSSRWPPFPLEPRRALPAHALPAGTQLTGRMIAGP